jgi:predicted membrane-bound spermidine synthase
MRVLGLAIFFVSGFAALLYQVVWQRLLVIFSGADVYSATIVVAAFMAGLGCGSLAGGVLADRVSRLGAVALFGAAELGIALFGIRSRAILYDGLYGGLGDLAAQPALMAGLLFVTLLWPTFLMGVSLPLLARVLTRSIDAAAGTIGWLYGCNTVGAALGALAAIWWFVPRQGLEGGLVFAAGLNLACAALALPLAGWLILRPLDPSAAPATAPAPARQTGGASIPFGFRTWVGLYALSGFLALSLEIVWFRLLGVMLKSTAFTFGTLLAQYLFWLGVGSALGSLLARRVRHPAAAFLGVQAAAGAWAGAGLALLLWRIETSPGLAWVRTYLGGYEPMQIAPAVGAVRSFLNDAIWHTAPWDTLPYEFLWMYFVLPALLLGPTTLLLGVAFPLLQRVVQTDLSRLGRRIGTLLVANIAGSTAGTMVTGWVLLSWLGTTGTLRLLVALSAVFALCAASLVRAPRRARIAAYAAAVVLAAGAAATVPRASSLWSRLHGTTIEAVRFGESATGLALLKERGQGLGDGIQVYLNGLGQSQLPYGDGTQTLLGALPAMIHPAPREAAIVGLGSGNTLAALAGRRDLERITSIEIVAPLIDLLDRSAPGIGYDGLTAVMTDPRVEHVAGDGRLFLRHTDRRFDIIEADALRPDSAYAGSLYSVEYFELLRARLRPGGFAVTWAPTERVEYTFTSVFDHVVQYGRVLIGSNEPIVLDREAIAARLADPATQDYYLRLGVGLTHLLEPRIWEPVTRVREAVDPELVNTDLFPRDEFDIPRVFDASMLKPEGER